MAVFFISGSARINAIIIIAYRHTHTKRQVFVAIVLTMTPCNEVCKENQEGGSMVRRGIMGKDTKAALRTKRKLEELSATFECVWYSTTILWRVF